MTPLCKSTISEDGVVVCRCDLPKGHAGMHHGVQQSEMYPGFLEYHREWTLYRVVHKTNCTYIRNQIQVLR